VSSSLSKPSPAGLSPTPNPNVPQIATPVGNLGALTVVTQSLKQAVDSLAGFRGKNTDRAVTFNDLINLGLVGKAQAASSAAAPAVQSIIQSILSTGNIAGVKDGSDAMPGNIGEYQSATTVFSAAVPLTDGVTANAVSITLPAGDWDVWGVVSFIANTGITIVDEAGGLSIVSATLPTAPTGALAKVSL
jgi:hypothetical protein